jgi:hypothetical protein
MSRVTIPRENWEVFLREFSRERRGWRVRIETHDLETGETVTSGEMRLGAVEFDLEDESTPRINVIVQMDNKTIKHIFVMPSELTLFPPKPGTDEALHFRSRNTATTVHLRAAGVRPSVDQVA